MRPVVQDVELSNGIHLPAETLQGFLWGGVERGIAWFETLPTLVEMVCQQHSITHLHPSPEMRMNLVLFGESAIHGPVVLKMAPPIRKSAMKLPPCRCSAAPGITPA